MQEIPSRDGLTVRNWHAHLALGKLLMGGCVMFFISSISLPPCSARLRVNEADEADVTPGVTQTVKLVPIQFWNKQRNA
jgi:hypothetical protein